MPSETIISVLSRENPTPTPHCLGPGPNTDGRDWLEVRNWTPWTEFDAKKLRAIYKDMVETPWRDA
ncbi:hypothetical protein C8A03DRAFT_39038 [Achaetomium macrosporum]|uniref:Uncharacterized protein n=1 Tax=Achaetomium macrosporum TaxID=79813 RepID=A0AAN7C110_9PEZI|nr:hypothetical protein C8A03DRAFT_39038 [Achaetomium macrosporum]